MLRTHGITRDPARIRLTARIPPRWYYEQQLLGFNYRMTDIHAALGVSQLERVDDYVERRNALARRYDRDWLACRCSCPASWMEPVGIPSLRGPPRNARDGAHRSAYDELRGKGIGVNVHYIPCICSPTTARSVSRGQCPEAEAHGDRRSRCRSSRAWRLTHKITS